MAKIASIIINITTEFNIQNIIKMGISIFILVGYAFMA